MLKNYDNNGTEEIILVTPIPGCYASEWGLMPAETDLVCPNVICVSEMCPERWMCPQNLFFTKLCFLGIFITEHPSWQASLVLQNHIYMEVILPYCNSNTEHIICICRAMRAIAYLIFSNKCDRSWYFFDDWSMTKKAFYWFCVSMLSYQIHLFGKSY